MFYGAISCHRRNVSVCRCIMNNSSFKIRMKYIISSVMLLLIVCIVIALYKSHDFQIVKNGVEFDDAMQAAIKDPHYCFIVTSSENVGTQFKIAYGEHEGADVNLIGSSPQNELSSIFFLSKNNTFLIKGKECNVDKCGLDWLDTYPDMYSIDVVSWEIVIPIQRDYTYRSSGQKSRWIAPSRYIDQFDVEQGDYLDILDER